MTHIHDQLSTGRRGGGAVKIPGSCAIWTLKPPILDRDGICLAQQRVGAGNLVLNGTFVRTLDGRAYIDAGLPQSFGRCVGIFSTGNLSAVAFTVYGFDRLREPVVAQIAAGPNNTTVQTTKAFWVVTRVAASATIGTNVEVGTVDKFGLPKRLYGKNRLLRVGWDDVAAENAATFVLGDGTSPATALTTDVRGCVTFSSAADGTREATVAYAFDNTTRQTELGVAQYGSGLV